MGVTYGPFQNPDQYKALQSRAEMPRLSSTRVTSTNVKDVLKSVNVHGHALESTEMAVKAIMGMPGMSVEAEAGRLIAYSAGGDRAFELPVFQERNILTRGGTRQMTIGRVMTFDAMGDTTHKSFANWFNQTITDLANTTGDVTEKRRALQNQISRVFGQIQKDGDGARAMVEPLGAVGRPKYGQAVAKEHVTAFHFPGQHEVAEAFAKAQEKRKAVYQTKDVANALNEEQVARLKYVQKLFEAANASQPGVLFSDALFSVTGKSIIDPLAEGGGIFPMLSSLQHSDLMLFGDTSQAAKGLSQLRHAAFITHDKLGVMDATSAQTRAGTPSAIKPDRMTPIVQTRTRFEMDKAASALEGKQGTFTPMGKVMMFVDPTMSDAFLKDSGGIRHIVSHVNDPAMSTMGQMYTKSVAVETTDELLYKGMLSPQIQEVIEREIANQKRRAGREAAAFTRPRSLDLSSDSIAD